MLSGNNFIFCSHWACPCGPPLPTHIGFFAATWPLKDNGVSLGEGERGMFYLLSLLGWTMKIIAEDSYGLLKRHVKWSNLYQALVSATRERTCFNYLPSGTAHTLGWPHFCANIYLTILYLSRVMKIGVISCNVPGKDQWTVTFPCMGEITRVQCFYYFIKTLAKEPFRAAQFCIFSWKK